MNIRHVVASCNQYLFAGCIPAISILLTACHNHEAQNATILLEKAGNNSTEIVKVINHYKNDPDTLKLKALYFLLENIDGMETMDTGTLSRNTKYFDFISKIDRSGLVFPTLTKGIDSINARLKNEPEAPEVKFYDELSRVKADFLISNIDNSFHVWRTMPWSKKVSFEDFCEYILPYRCTNTYSDQIRDFFLKRYTILPDSIKSTDDMHRIGEFIINDLKPWFKEDPNILVTYPFLAPIKFSDLLKARIGACNDANSVRVAALRAMGVATAYDQIPNWGNSNWAHYWYKIIDPLHDTVKSKITNRPKEERTQHIISATSYDEPFFPGTPSHTQISYGRTVPKVYRQCFSKQKSSLAWIAGVGEIPAYFQNVRLKDVTEHYVETTNITIPLNIRASNHKYAYLCVFDNQQWTPVAWARIDGSSAEFTSMGKNIVYLPAYYENGSLIPASLPFLLKSDGTIELISQKKGKELINLYTKFPLRTYVIKSASYMIGGRFQLANKADLSDSITVHTIKNLPFYLTEIKIRSSTPSRYLAYQFEGLNTVEIAELEFYGLNKTGKEVKLAGTPIGNPGYYPYPVKKLFDSIFYNFYRAEIKPGNKNFVGIDLGENNKTIVTRIRYMPNTDDNAVKEDNTYELFYWDYQWKSLGKMKAKKGNYVSFSNVPRGTLFVLKNTAGGVQERIFTYQDGKQIFW